MQFCSSCQCTHYVAHAPLFWAARYVFCVFVDLVIHNSSPSQCLLIKPDGDNNCDQSSHNQTLTLQCQVTGHPSPVISWYHNGELVNFTDYFDNTTITVENNTWTLQGGDPCNLIGYWQCFATNNVETVHSTTRVLPFGEYFVLYKKY